MSIGMSDQPDPFEETLYTSGNPRATEPHNPIMRALNFWIYPFTRFHRTPVSKRIWIYMAFIAGYAFLVDQITSGNFPNHLFKEAAAAGYTSLILGVLLVFRTNSAYDRWWEGRRLWGQLVNDSRNLALKVKAYIPSSVVSDREKAEFGELIISFAYALKHHLRGTNPSQPLPGLRDVPEGMVHGPVYLAGAIYEKVKGWQSRGLDELFLLQLDLHLKAFMDICGSCERIRNSPLALSYRAFMRQGIALNLLFLPWYIEPQFEYWTSLPIILIGSYFLIGLELIAEDIEEPFGFDGDDLPLDSICESIKKTITEILPLSKQLKFTASFVPPRIDPLK